MAMDAIDATAVVGLVAVALASTVLEGATLAAALGGLLLTVAVWRLHGGRVWEALGWTAWVGTAVVLAVGAAGTLRLVAFFGSMLVGLGLLFGGRFGVLPEVRTEEPPARERGPE